MVLQFVPALQQAWETIPDKVKYVLFLAMLSLTVGVGLLAVFKPLLDFIISTIGGALGINMSFEMFVIIAFLAVPLFLALTYGVPLLRK